MLFVQLLVMLSIVGVILQFQCIYADVYMHNPRGSNDRNCERNVNRNNGNRLFDSQNNNNGGYACPRGVGDENFQNEMGDAKFIDPGTSTSDDDDDEIAQNKRLFYYSGSILPIEFTSQHGCGSNSKIQCEIIMQYACEDTLDPIVNNFWPWVQDKAESTSKFYNKQHFRSGNNIGAPRDGVPRDSDDAATDTIPDNVDNAIPDTKEDRRFGMQESFDYYQLCQRTERNKGLYTADQLLRRNDRRATRQNPNGNRNGFECPEERDHYPWWAPSPWVDVAVLTDSAADEVCTPLNNATCTTRCQYYMKNSMNFKSGRKGYCDVDHATATVADKLRNARWTGSTWYNNKIACETATVNVNNIDVQPFKWYEVSHDDLLTPSAKSPTQYAGGKNSTHAFVCAHTQYSRTNQLGNAANDQIMSSTSTGNVEKNVIGAVEANRFMWTIPTIPTMRTGSGNPYAPSDYTTDQAKRFMEDSYKSCVFRIRYNISSADFPAWPDDAIDKKERSKYNMTTSANNSKTYDDPNTPLTQDPYVYIGPGDAAKSGEKFVSLAVNTNQYARTFQDRSYVFSIKNLPQKEELKPTMVGYEDAKKRLSQIYDQPYYDQGYINKMKSNLAAGGKIYNVNVRGKRGNIVQTFPSVEYDFVPNALSLSTKDMIHFQWTGSDYNPRRGCNDGEGGPPDLNTYSTDGNANLNSRADRSNIVFTEHMANNVPRQYITYDYNNASIPMDVKKQNLNDTVNEFAPCYSSSDDATTRNACIDSIMWLAYLNQQKDGLSLALRADKKCLTQQELDAISNQDVANNHPLNCAKMNAKPIPYFNGGIMMMKRAGWFPFYSTRNNNFSNRQQGGIICVAGTRTVNGKTETISCSLQNGTGVLQDQNPEVNGRTVPISPSYCESSALGQKGSTANGAMSCLNTKDNSTIPANVETLTVKASDNDNHGDGNKMGCPVYTEMFFTSLFEEGPKTTEQQVALAVGLLFVGLLTSWLAYYLYNRWQATHGKDKLKTDTSWQKKQEEEMKRQKRVDQQTFNSNTEFTAISSGRPGSSSKMTSPSARNSGGNNASPNRGSAKSPSSRGNSNVRRSNNDHV